MQEKEKTLQPTYDKLLTNMQEKENRKAKFKTVISLIWNDKEYLFEGVSEGKIIDDGKRRTWLWL